MRFAAPFVALCALLAVCARATLPSGEQSALVAFFHATGGSAWRNHTGWLEAGTDPCAWFGVTCAGAAAGVQHVSTLFLSNNNLVGTLPEELGGLTELTAIDLGLNKLTGPLPASFAHLTKLYAISLKENTFSGPIDFSLMGLSLLFSLFSHFTTHLLCVLCFHPFQKKPFIITLSQNPSPKPQKQGTFNMRIWTLTTLAGRWTRFAGARR